jgi:hypothetical protein
MTYDTAKIMKEAHAATRRLRHAWPGRSYRDVFAVYLGQKWVLEQHRVAAARCTGATVTVAKAFDNSNSPIWSMR